MDQEPTPKAPRAWSGVRQPGLVIPAVLLLVVIAAFGWQLARRGESSARDLAARTLTSIADLKANQIEGWISERRGDAAVVHASERVRRLLAAPGDPAARAAVLDYFGVLRTAYDYDAIGLFDGRGERVLSTADAKLDRLDCVRSHVLSALGATNLVLTDLHRGNPAEPIHMSLLCPIAASEGGAEPAEGVVLLLIDPHRFLYPFLLEWPVPTRTGETLLLRRDGEDVLYLSGTRHRGDMALSLRLPVARTESPEARAVLGDSGLLTGPDYRGVPVMAVAHGIKGTSWYMVAEVDQEEFDQGIRQGKRRLGFVAGLSLLVVMMGAGLVVRQQRIRFMRLAGETERREAALNETIIASVPGTFYMLNAAGRYVRWNDYHRHEIVGRTELEMPRTLALDAVHPEDRAMIADRISNVMTRGVDETVEARLLLRGGPEYRWMLLTGRRIVIGGESYLVGTGFDVTERRKAVEALQQREEIFAAIVNQAGDSIVLVDGATGRFAEFNQVAHESLGYTREEFAGMTPADIQAEHSPEEIREHIQQVQQAGRLNFDSKHRGRNGQLVDVRVSLRALRIHGRDFMTAVWADITDRKRSEVALRDSQEQLRQIIAAAQDAIIMVGPRGAISLWNDAAVRVFGYSREEALGQHLHRFLAPERFQEAAARGFPAFQKDGHGPAIGRISEWVGRRRDGSEFPIELSVAPLQLGGEWHAVGILRDITARKRAVERLRKVCEVQALLHDPDGLEDKLKRITDAVVDIFKADFARIWLSRPGDLCESGCMHAAITEGPHVCRRRDLCLHLVASSGRYTHLEGGAHSRVPFGCYKIGCVASGSEPSFLTNEVTSDPRVHDHEWARGLGLVSFAGYQLRPPHGEAIGVMALFSKHALSPEEDALLVTLSNLIVPVIQAARAAETLRASEANLNRAQAVGRVGSWHVDVARSRMTWSEETYRIFGVPSGADLTFDTFLSRLHSEDRQLVETACGEALKGGPCDVEHRILVGGEVRWIRERAELELDPRGRVVGVLGTAQDVTERKIAEEALQARNQELVRFTYTVSHDLKSPLVTIQTFLGFLEKDLAKGDKERVKSDFGYIERAASKMLNLLEELLELSRIGRKMNAPQDVPFGEIVGAALDAVAGQIAERRVRVVFTDAPLLLHGDRPRLTEVFQNLIDNAVKFMGDQAAPRVEIGVEASGPGQERIFFVRDNGVGIDPRHKDKLFGLFEKLNPDLPGAGMGLALIKRIVEVHGGRIWVESGGPGLGSTFRFTLQGTRSV